MHVENISCVITNSGQHQGVMPSLFLIVLWALLKEKSLEILNLSSNYCFSMLLSSYLYYPYDFFLLSSGWNVIAVCVSISIHNNSSILVMITWVISTLMSKKIHNAYFTHWGWVMHICVSKPTTNGSDNGLSPGRRQTIIWTNAGILLIGPLGTNLSEILSEIHTFSLKKMHL